MNNENEVRDAIKVVSKALLDDEGYRISWQANIAMAFKDQAEWDRRSWDKEELDITANNAAEYFVALLCKDQSETEP